MLTRNPCISADVIKAYYTHEEIILPVIKKHHEQFPSSTSTTPSPPSSPTISRTSSVKVQPTSLSSLPPAPKSTTKVPEPRLSPYGPSYGTRAAIKPEEVAKNERTLPTPTSSGFGGGDMLGALLSSSYKNKSKDGKKEKGMPKVMMTPF